MKCITVLPLLGLLAGCASADYAQLADSATTAYGLTHGYAEANPLFGHAPWPVIGAVKLGAVQLVKRTPPTVCVPGLQALTVAGWGAALWNLGVMAGCAPCALPLVIGATVWQWDSWMNDARTTCAVKLD